MSDVHRLKRKVKKYEAILKDLMEEDEESDLTQSSIYEKTKDGEIQKKVLSNTGESFIVVDHGRDLTELNKSSYRAIKEQDSYARYKNVENKAKTAGGVYGWGTYLVGIGNLVVWFL